MADEVIIDTIVSKYAIRCRLYRQDAILLRDAGIEITRATMCGWVMTVGETLSRIVDDLGVARPSSAVPADETRWMPRHTTNKVKIIKPSSGSADAGARAVFDFRMSRGREGPSSCLGRLRGRLRTDDCIAYDAAWAGLGWCTPAAGAMREGTCRDHQN